MKFVCKFDFKFFLDKLKMPAYHSELECHESFGNMAKMPLKNEGNIKGNAPVMQVNHSDPEASRDIMRECIIFIRKCSNCS